MGSLRMRAIDAAAYPGVTCLFPALGRSQEVSHFMPEQIGCSGSFVGQPIQCHVCECCIFMRQEPSTCDRGIHHERHQELCLSWRQAKISFVVTGFCLARSRRRISRTSSYRSPTIHVTRAIGTEPRQMIRSSTRAKSADRWAFASPTFTRRVMQPGPPLHPWQQPDSAAPAVPDL